MKTPLLSEYEKPNKIHYNILILCWAGWVFDIYDLVLYTFLLIPIGEEFHLSKLMLSFVFGASLAASALGGVCFGILSDRYGRKAVLQWTILTYSIGTFLSALAWNFETLLAFRILTGLGVGGEWATGQTYVGETFPPKVRGRYGAYMQTGAPIGVALASIVGGFIAPGLGWRTCFFISSLPAVLVIFVRMGLPESDLWLKEKQLTTGGGTSVAAHLREGGSMFFSLFTKAYRKIFLQSLFLSIFDISAYWFTYSWLPGYLFQERQLSMAKSAAWILVTQTGGFLGYSLFGLIADWIGRRPAYSAYSGVRAVGLVMITLFWDTVVIYPPLILTFMFLVGFGSGSYGGYGPLFTELFDTSIRNTAMGSAFNLARGIQLFTPVIIAVIAKRHGLGGGIFLATIFSLLTGIWIWTFPETKGRRLIPQ